jgi:hypothetical protein
MFIAGLIYSPRQSDLLTTDGSLYDQILMKELNIFDFNQHRIDAFVLDWSDRTVHSVVLNAQTESLKLSHIILKA